MNGLPDAGKPTVLFLCVHNAGRSQMALGFFRQLAGDNAVAWSGGSEPAHQINPSAVETMRERGIDITGEHPKPWTDEVVRAADGVVTMGCGDTCPVFPGKRYLDWQLDDPAGKGVADVRPIRDETTTIRDSADPLDIHTNKRSRTVVFVADGGGLDARMIWPISGSHSSVRRWRANRATHRGGTPNVIAGYEPGPIRPERRSTASSEA